MRSKEDRLKYCQKWKEKLDNDYSFLKERRTESLKFRDSDPTIVELVKGRSSITTTDMQDAIDMAKPDILETVAGIDEPLKLDPDAANYVESVKKLEVLGNVMIKRKNKWFRICSDFLDDSMVLLFGCIKYRWIEEKKIIKKTYENLTEEEKIGLLQDEGASLGEETTDETGTITTINITLTDEYVKYDSVPSERIKFPLDTRDFSETPIVIEEIRLYEHEFRTLYGEKNFNAIKEAKDALDSTTPDTAFSERFKHVGGLDHFYDKKVDKYKTYESYFWEYDDKLKQDVSWMMTFYGDEVLQDEENKYGKPPYRGGSPFLIAHSLIGKGYLDILKNIQRQNTFLLRQINDTILMNLNRRNFVDVTNSGLNIDDYMNNSAMNALIRCNGDVSERSIRPETKVPLGQEVLSFWEMMKQEKDAHIPTPRAFSGLEGGPDERTYRGKQLKVNQASKKLLMMVRTYMEEVFAPLFQDTLDCIAKFMKKQTIVRYLNEDYTINPEDVICKYALIVNVGLGSHDKQDLIVKLQQLIELALKQSQLGVFTAQNFYYINSELVKAMGFLNTMDFVTNPNMKQTIMQLVQMVGQLMDHLTQLHQEDPEMQAITQQMGQMIQQVMAAMGDQGKNGGGANAQGTQPGQLPPSIPEQPMNPMNAQTGVTGGGFFA